MGHPVVLMQSEYQRSLYTLFALKFVLIKPYCFLHYKSSASKLFHGIRMPSTYPEASVAQGPKRITQLKPPGGLDFDSSGLSQTCTRWSEEIQLPRGSSLSFEKERDRCA